MGEEMKALERNSTWDIVDKPKDKRLVDCNINLMLLLIDIKRDWLQRDIHKPITLTEETFTPMAKVNAVRIILSLAAHID
ncbi:hypothetical protein CR513_28560, partial [Mucuna pruriens]